MKEAGHTVHKACFDVTDEAAIVAAFERFDAEHIEIEFSSTMRGSSCESPWWSLQRKNGAR